MLEKRQFYKHRETGEIIAGKNRGLTLKDIGYVVSNWPDIQRAMLEATL